MKRAMVLVLLMICLVHISTVHANEPFIIVVDPGHGENGSGASAVFDGKVIQEEIINLKIAKYLKEELEEYQGVKVILTRDGDYDVDLLKRTQVGINNDANLLISIHNNAYGEDFSYDHGSTVLVSRGQYNKKVAQEEQELGVNILYELSEIGLEDQGLLLRDSENGEKYENNQVADYYAIVRNGIKNYLPSIIVEHAFVDHESDYDQFLSSDNKLKQLAVADANGIARYYQLVKEDDDMPLEKLENVTETLLYIKDENQEHNEIYEKTFFKTEERIETEGIENEGNNPEQVTEDVRESQEYNTKSVFHINLVYICLAVVGVLVACILVVSAENINQQNKNEE